MALSLGLAIREGNRLYEDDLYRRQQRDRERVNFEQAQIDRRRRMAREDFDFEQARRRAERQEVKWTQEDESHKVAIDTAVQQLEDLETEAKRRGQSFPLEQQQRLNALRLQQQQLTQAKTAAERADVRWGYEEAGLKRAETERARKENASNVVGKYQGAILSGSTQAFATMLNELDPNNTYTLDPSDKDDFANGLKLIRVNNTTGEQDTFTSTAVSPNEALAEAQKFINTPSQNVTKSMGLINTRVKNAKEVADEQRKAKLEVSKEKAKNQKSGLKLWTDAKKATADRYPDIKIDKDGNPVAATEGMEIDPNRLQDFIADTARLAQSQNNAGFKDLIGTGGLPPAQQAIATRVAKESPAPTGTKQPAKRTRPTVKPMSITDISAGYDPSLGITAPSEDTRGGFRQYAESVAGSWIPNREQTAANLKAKLRERNVPVSDAQVDQIVRQAPVEELQNVDQMLGIVQPVGGLTPRR